MRSMDTENSAIGHLVSKLNSVHEEVRVRSLENISSKLGYGIVDKIELASNRILISKLIDWFNRNNSKHKECLELILKLCSVECGAQNFCLLGGIDFLQSLRMDLTPECQLLVNDIVEQTFLRTDNIEISEFNLSPPERLQYKKSGSKPEVSSYNGGASTALPSKSVKLKTEKRDRSQNIPQVESQTQAFTPDIPTTGCGFQLVEFPWISLSDTDVHVLESTNQSLISKDDKLVVSACEFLVDVMLYDFPAEIFLQRPLIIKTLVRLLDDCGVLQKTPDVGLAVIETMIQLINSVTSRIHFHNDPINFAPKQDILALNPAGFHHESSTTISSNASHVSRPSLVGISDGKEDNNLSDNVSSSKDKSGSSRRSVSVQITSPNIEELELQDLQLLLPDFCLLIHKTAVSLTEHFSHRFTVELYRLLRKVQHVLKLSVNNNLWSEPTQYAQDLCEKLRLQLHLMSHLANKYHQISSSMSSTNTALVTEKRKSYVSMTLLTLDLLHLVPKDQVTHVIGCNERQLLYTLCCDESLSKTSPNAREIAANYLKVSDVGSYDVYSAAKVICDSITNYCQFLLNVGGNAQDVESLLSLAKNADKAIYSIPYHMNTEIIEPLISLCSDSWCSLSDQTEVRDLLVSVLLKYLAHPIVSVKREAYQAIASHLKSVLSFDKPTVEMSDRVLFLTHHSLLWEVACFGLSSDIPEIMKGSQDIFNYLMQCRMLVSGQVWSAVCQSLITVLPVLQSYSSPDITLGKCVLALIDDHFDSNISKIQCVKGAIRILFSRDTAGRIQATKVVLGHLNSLYSSYMLYPMTDANRYQDHIVRMDCLVREVNAEMSQRSVLNEDSVTRVMRILTDDDVESSIRITSLNQLSVIIQNPLVHRYFLEQGGLELILKLITDAVSPERIEKEEVIPPAICTLANILQYSHELRQRLASDLTILLVLTRCCWMFPSGTRASTEVAHCLTYIVFNEISPLGPNQSMLSLPKTCTIRYKIPMKVLTFCDVSSHRVDTPPGSDPLMQTLPHQMIRVFWNVTWHGKLEVLLESLDNCRYHSGSELLALKDVDIMQLKCSTVSYAVLQSLERVTNATNHADVTKEISMLTSLALISGLANDKQTLSNITWTTYFNKFLTIHPVAPVDKELLVQVMSLFSTLLDLRLPSLTTNLLSQLRQLLHDEDSMLLQLVQDSSYVDADCLHRRPLQSLLLHIISVIGQHTSSAGSEPARGGLVRGGLVRGVLRRLSMADASNFYNLASLESSVLTLLHLTSSCGWSLGSVDMDSRTLCNQLIRALLEVLSAFHLGRQGNSLSYMGKGVLRSATLCLRHVFEELSYLVRETDWFGPWFKEEESRSKLDWMKELWHYRDPEVRAASLGVGLALAQCTDEIYDPVITIFTEVLNIAIDTTECSLVRQQAVILMSNLLLRAHKLQEELVKHQMLEVLEDSNFINEFLMMLSTDLFTETKLNIDSLQRKIRPDFGDSISNVVYPTLVTPGVLASMMELLTLIVSVMPDQSKIVVENTKLIPSLLSLIASDSVTNWLSADPDEMNESEFLMRGDVISLGTKVISLLRCCVVTSDVFRRRLTINDNHLSNIMSLLVTSEDRDLRPVWCEALQHMSAILYLEDKNIIANILDCVVQYWKPLTGATLAILKLDVQERRIAVLEFWCMLLDRAADGHYHRNVVDLVDATCNNEVGEEQSSTGSDFCNIMLSLYDSLQLRYDDKECIQERLVMIICFKNLLAVSQQAKSTALESGLAESLLSHIDSFVKKLNLLPTQRLGTLTEDNVLLAELVVSLELLTNFMASSSEVKVVVSEIGFANLIHRMWFYCLADSQLLSTVLSALITYTNTSTLACRHLVCSSHISSLNMESGKLQSNPSSLAHILVKLTCSHLSKLKINLSLVTKLMHLMCNFSLSPDTLSVICKSNLVQGFSSCNPKLVIKRKPKLQLSLTKLWLQLLMNLSYSVEGQKVILAMEDSLGILLDYMESYDECVKEYILIIIYNFSVSHKAKIVTDEAIPLEAVQILEDPKAPLEHYRYSSAILETILYDSMKGKALIKSLSIPERLQELANQIKQAKATKGKLHKNHQYLLESVQGVILMVSD